MTRSRNLGAEGGNPLLGLLGLPQSRLTATLRSLPAACIRTGELC